VDASFIYVLVDVPDSLFSKQSEELVNVLVTLQPLRYDRTKLIPELSEDSAETIEAFMRAMALRTAVCVCVLALHTRPAEVPPKPELKIIHFDVGDGDATLLLVNDGGATPKPLFSILIDGGSKKKGATVVVPGIQELGIKNLDYVIATHIDDDHTGGVRDVVAAIPIAEGGAVYDREHRWPSSPDGPLKAGAILPLGDRDAWKSFKEKLEIKCVAAGGNTPGDDWKGSPLDENAKSLAFVVRFGNFRYFLGGDLTGGGPSGWGHSADIETRVARSVGRVSALRVNHHGSVTSTNDLFLGSLDPVVAIISAGPDQRSASLFRWPSPEVVDRLGHLAALKAIYVTGAVDGKALNERTRKKLKDRQGMITLTTKGEDRFEVNGDAYDLTK
jgi:beta-lactamase superfamily II metal-dependent hydrolase